ncbi:hypothetical protein PsYK624_084960 [Phanerochaete sordida]|uniref:Uncharacterized protein n=1 Tax=Phanerochaete sordida TaxID=48140 RepID=A0A9P3GCW9_9APHY|nr:hypothetical protein PsYK624_084960 [Phanerochaete sordida]
MSDSPQLPFDLGSRKDTLYAAGFCGVVWRDKFPDDEEKARCIRLVDAVRATVKRKLCAELDALAASNAWQRSDLEGAELLAWREEFGQLVAVVRELERDHDRPLRFLAAHASAQRGLYALILVAMTAHMQNEFLTKEMQYREQRFRRGHEVPELNCELPLLFGVATIVEHRRTLERWARELEWRICWATLEMSSAASAHDKTAPAR